MIVKLEAYQDEDYARLCYDLNETQLQYTATPRRALEKIKQKQDKQKHPVCIFSGRELCGFFVLDQSNDKLEYTDNPRSVLLRSFSVNPQHQGKGIGKEAMLLVPAFVRNTFTDMDEIILSVNVSNTPAYTLYLACGFKQEKRTVTGRSGLQYILSYKLYPG